MADQIPIKKKLSTTNPGFYDLAEFETGDTIPAEFLPAGTVQGDMLKSQYDADNDGIVDLAAVATTVNDGYF